MPSVRCPYCDNVFKWSTEMGEGRAECPLCGKAIEIVRKTGGREISDTAEPKATTGWGTDGFSSDTDREEYGEIQKGDVLGGFRIDEILGAGAMAVVYRATQLSLDRSVALKILPTKYAQNETFVRQFDSETEVLASLNHPNIVNIIDRGREGDTYFFAMEYVEGTTLGEMVAAGEVEEEFFLEIMEHCADALSYAHSRGIIHRDIKPANIMLNDQGMPKIADFGIAGLLAEAEADRTGRRRVMGTRGYMPPEQEQDVRRTDERSDIFALGAVIYRVLTGQIPSHLPPGPPSQINPEVDPGIDSLVLKCLEKDRDQRYQSAEELNEALKAYHRQISRAGEVCPECKEQNPVTQKTCLHCGADLDELFDVCPECGEENRIDVDICRSCGASISRLRNQTAVRISKIEERARELAVKDRYEDAIRELQKVLEVKGKVFRRAREKAERLISNYQKQRREYYHERTKLGKRLAGEGKLDEALDVLESVPEEFAESEGAAAAVVNAKSRRVVAEKKVGQAEHLIEEQELEEAEELLEQVENLWVNCPGLKEARIALQNSRETAEMLDYELAEVRSYLDEGSYQEARDALQFALSTMPDHPQVQKLLKEIEKGQKQNLFRQTLKEGKRAFKEGEYRRAVRSWRTTLDLLPEDDKRREKLEHKLAQARARLAETGGVVMLKPAQVVPLRPASAGALGTANKPLVIALMAVVGAIVLVGGLVAVLAAGG
ncbi:MAG: protein kinase domain-containing protein [Planctomycetota bacterium]